MRFNTTVILLLITLLASSLAQEPKFIDPGPDAHKRYPTNIFFTKPDQAITVSWDGTAKIWDLKSGRVLKTLTDPENPNGKYDDSAYLREKNQLIIRDGQSILYFDLTTGKLLNRLKPKTFINSLSAQSDHLYLITNDGVEKLTHQGEVVAKFEKRRLKSQIVARGDHIVIGQYTGQIYILNTKDLTQKKTLETKGFEDFTLSPNGKSLAYTSRKKFEVVLIDTGKVLLSKAPELPGIADTPNRFEPHWTNQGLYWARSAVPKDSHTPFIFQGVQLKPFPMDFSNSISALAAGPNGQLLLGFYYGGLIHYQPPHNFTLYAGQYFTRLKPRE